MAYNWNNTVKITVPVGLNGWDYSGQITINGITTTFPVGVETSLPEPVAAKIQHMIAVEEANKPVKPDNHYVGAVTIPAGKKLTLAKGAKLVDESAAPTVILEETELTVGEENNAHFDTPWENDPVVGKVYCVTYNGTPYDCPAISNPEMPVEYGAVFLGNMALAGAEGGNADAPFLVLCFSNAAGAELGSYGIAQSTDGATVFTLSIVEKAEAESGGGGGGFVVKATITEMDDTGTSGKVTVDKTFAETLEAIQAGRYVVCHMDIGEAGCQILPALNYILRDNGASVIVFMINSGLASIGVTMQENEYNSFRIEVTQQ